MNKVHSFKCFCRSIEIKKLCTVLKNEDKDFKNSYDSCDNHNEKILVDALLLLKKVSSVFISLHHVLILFFYFYSFIL